MPNIYIIYFTYILSYLILKVKMVTEIKGAMCCGENGGYSS